MLSRCRVVLVRPHYAGNVGSAARVMRNFGLTDLVLVDPVAAVRTLDATMMATRGLPILQAARVVPTLAEAVADCTWVLATSGETGGVKRQGFWGTPEEQVPAVLAALADGPAALVFGPEPSGLTVPEIAACHAMAFIPADPGYPSLNLAQAVAVMVYELHRQSRHTAPAPPVAAGDRPAGFADQERMFAKLKEALTAVRFLWDFRGDGIFHVIRQVIVRGRPTLKELAVFHGLAGQLSYVARRYGVVHPRDGRPPPGDDDRLTPGEPSP
jgi:tRNA/rRNA methyltransferase